MDKLVNWVMLIIYGYLTKLFSFFFRPTPISSLMAQYGFQEKLLYSKWLVVLVVTLLSRHKNKLFF